jgi:hypothetical protein
MRSSLIVNERGPAFFADSALVGRTDRFICYSESRPDAWWRPYDQFGQPASGS